MRSRPSLLLCGGSSLAAAGLFLVPTQSSATADPAGPHRSASTTATPIQHLVVIFQENVSFDHYFGTYPTAANPPGENPFHPVAGTPTVSGLTAGLLTDNPNMSNPQRLNPDQAATCDQDHSYTAEENAFDHGLMDQFVQNTGHGLTLAQCLQNEGNPAPDTGISPNYAVMDYYDGNTVTGLWNYAQNFAMSDNSYGTNVGPSTPGAINVTAGNTYGAICGPSSAVINAPTCEAATHRRTRPANRAQWGPAPTTATPIRSTTCAPTVP